MFWFEMLMYQTRDRYYTRQCVTKANNKLIPVQVLLIYFMISTQSTEVF